MTSRRRTMISTLGAVVFAAALAPIANAGCGEMPGKAAPAGKQPQYMQAAYRPARFVLVDNDLAGANVVGLWHVVFSGGFDDGYAEWHSDGTEIMNSGFHNPSSGNFCMGVWTKTGGSSYVLTHVALAYTSTTSTSPDVIVILREQVTVDHTGNRFTGMYAAQAYAPVAGTASPNFGSPLGPPATGTITGDRITAN